MFIFQFHRLFSFHLTQWMFRPITAKECYGWQSRWGGELGVQRLPFNCEERVLCGISILYSFFFLSAFYFLSLPLQESPVISHGNFLFLHCPPFLHWFFFPPAFPSSRHLSSSSSSSLHPSVVLSLPLKFTPHRFPLVHTLSRPPQGVCHGDR